MNQTRTACDQLGREKVNPESPVLERSQCLLSHTHKLSHFLSLSLALCVCVFLSSNDLTHVSLEQTLTQTTKNNPKQKKGILGRGLLIVYRLDTICHMKIVGFRSGIVLILYLFTALQLALKFNNREHRKHTFYNQNISMYYTIFILGPRRRRTITTHK